MNSESKIEIEEEYNQDKPFCDREYEEVEDGYIDDRGFYTSPNGSFWDDDHTYFNHLGFDKHGGSYDKFGVYHPGPGYEEKTGLYKDQKEYLTTIPEQNDNEKEFAKTLKQLEEQENEDERIVQKYEKPEEDSEDSDEEDKSIDLKEVYEDFIANEKEYQKMMSQHS